MRINLVRYDRNSDGTKYDKEPVVWDTNNGDLSRSSASRYGGGYEFVGTDTLDGGLSMTVRFDDIADLDRFADIAQGAFHGLSDEDTARWEKFTTALRELTGHAPRRPLYQFELDAYRASQVQQDPRDLTLNTTDIPNHSFEASHSGRVCSRMVMRSGHWDACGLPPEHPVHNISYHATVAPRYMDTGDNSDVTWDDGEDGNR